jgi:hypothetical protein
MRAVRAKAGRPVNIRLPMDNIRFWRAVDLGDERIEFAWCGAVPCRPCGERQILLIAGDGGAPPE